MGTDTPVGHELASRVTGVRSSFDGPATLRLALKLHPRTRQIYTIGGAAGSDSMGVGPGWIGLRESEFHMTFRHLASQPLPQLLEKLSLLPPNSLVVDLSMFGSGAGTTIPSEGMAERIARASRAPIYAAYDPLVGYGVVGAVTTPMQEIGHETADLVAQVLSHRSGEELPAMRTLAATPIFDWRQLRRWGIRTRQLPAGSIVQFKPPSLWQQHATFMLTTGGFILLQSGLILALVLQSRRRRRAEREAQKRRQELAHMTRVATMGELTASLAHEINQPLAAILSNAQAAQRLLANGGTDGDEIREILADIAADDQRAGEVIRRMRALLRKGESDLAFLDVNELVAEVVALVRGEMILQNVSLSLDLSPHLRRVHGDRIQLQQVLLNLMMNALDAMKDMSGGHRGVVVRTKTTNARTVQVSVKDFGAGVSPEKLEQIFEPFVTTKPHGMGLGLSICRSIIQAHGGRIGTTNNEDRGATFWFTLPATEEVKK
jgi:signal transduction histidine kinase